MPSLMASRVYGRPVGWAARSRPRLGDSGGGSPKPSSDPDEDLHLSRMPLLDRVQADATAAMKAGDRERAGALRMIVSELQKAAKAVAPQGDPSDGARKAYEVEVLQRERKRRLESVTAYRDAGRHDLADAEQREAELIEAYLPAQLSEAELHAIVGDVVAESGASSPKEMGKVMAAVMPRVKGRADGRRVSAVVQEKLTA